MSAPVDSNTALDSNTAPLATAGSADWASLGELWDAIVVGAGPAGGLSALRLAERGRRVLLVESKRFPREKVCGGCLNRRAWSVLAANGLTAHLDRAGAIKLERLHIACGRRTVDWSMPTMHALSRSKLDVLIAGAAVERGATFLSETQARIEPAASQADLIHVQLKHRSGRAMTVKARVAIAADGLAHSSLIEHAEAASQVAPDSRIGLGTSIFYDGPNYPAGRLTMVVGRAGYVGLTRVEHGRLNVAAAVSAESLRAGEADETTRERLALSGQNQSGPALGGNARAAGVIRNMLAAAGLEPPAGLNDAQWLGTPQLTRESRRWSARRVFLVGDATGYVEPFTGEGMSWALAGGHEVCPYAELAISKWSDALAAQWHQHWRKTVRRHQLICRGLAWVLRHPRLAEATLGGAGYTPWLSRWLMQRVAGSNDWPKPLEQPG